MFHHSILSVRASVPLVRLVGGVDVNVYGQDGEADDDNVVGPWVLDMALLAAAR